MRAAALGLLALACAAPAGRPELAPIARRPSAPKQGSANESSFAACPSSVPEGYACVPGGRYVRGSDDGPENERPASEVSVSTFLMATHEVTNARYRECVAAGSCRAAMRFPGYLGASQPAVAMRWQDADAYCRWRGARLPTEAEWERAATGPDEHRYPWGDDRNNPCERAIVKTSRGRGCGREVTWPVGSLAPNAYGLYDMSGNVWEWVSDHYAPCYRNCNHECGDACGGRDPRGPCGGGDRPCPEARGQRIVRGGSWWYGIERATVTARRGVPGDNPNPHRFGLRCAMDLPAR
ncbi:MAG: SUMF1/EgtB/PvdO family nonheme iron enzyme [Sandaracinaceae bacterium]|nr:SUMF1/EgtB/PvdO family nonheme iron enzyme [Sandaracinaceae bacterium]